jgi:hypothetical protein
MTLAEALAAANAGQQGAQFSAGGQTFVLPPGVQGAPIEDEPVVDPPRTVEEALALPRLPLPAGLDGDAYDVLGQAAAVAPAARSVFDGLGGVFDPTDPRNDPDRNIAGNIGAGLSVANTVLGGPALLGSGLSMAGQGISANRRTAALDDILTGAGLPETPEGTAVNDWWSQGITGLFGAGEPAQAAAAREIAEEASRPEGRTENATLALEGMSDRVNEELARQGLVAGAYSVPQPLYDEADVRSMAALGIGANASAYDERTVRNMARLGAASDAGYAFPRASMYSAPVADALANLADVGALPGPGMSVAVNTPVYSAATGFGPHISPQYAPEARESAAQVAPAGAMGKWAAAADQVEQAQADAAAQQAAQQAARDQAAVFAAGEGFTDYRGGTGNRGFDSFSDWADAAFG